jgi:hypothetical protein
MQRQELLFSLLLMFSTAVFSQTLHHQSLGAQGSTALLSSGVFVSQSIGQQSITGTTQISDMSVLQGFQQNSKAIRFVTAGLPSSTNLKTFPNPFSDQLNFQFDSEVSGDVEISVFESSVWIIPSGTDKQRSKIPNHSNSKIKYIHKRYYSNEIPYHFLFWHHEFATRRTGAHVLQGN